MADKNFGININLIKGPSITSKAVTLLGENRYTFLVDPKLTKPNVKEVIEFLFDVKIVKINSCNLAKKKRRVGRSIGVRPRYKKVIIKLAEGSQINYYSKN